MARAKDLLISAALLFAGRRRTRLPRGAERIVPAGRPDPRAELLVLGLLGAASLFAVGFVVVYVLDRLPNHTQLLGACLGLSLLCIAAALILTAKRVIVTEEIEGDYPAQE